MSQEDADSTKTREPLRPTVYRIEEPSAPFGLGETSLQPSADPPVDRSYQPNPRNPRLPWILFGLTCLSTWVAGMRFFGLWGGLQYSLCVMSILTAHEMGHYLQALRYGVPASLPMFIPMPISPMGTMGAVIFQRPGVAGRRAMFDIAITGPLAGLVLTLPILWYGLRTAQEMSFSPSDSGYVFSDPLLVKGLSSLIRGPLPEGKDLRLNPFLFAGWVGILVTALNMFPLGQLDGGHILYTLVGPKARVVTRYLFRALIALVVWAGLTQDSTYFTWTLFMVLLGMTGVEHPPTADDSERIGSIRKVLGWLTLTFVIWGFTPRPMYVVEGEKPPGKTQVIETPKKPA